MIQIGKIETFVRGGPELPDELIPGETADQFDSFLNALVISPSVPTPEGGSPVYDESGLAGIEYTSGPTVAPWNESPDGLPITKGEIVFKPDGNTAPAPEMTAEQMLVAENTLPEEALEPLQTGTDTAEAVDVESFSRFDGRLRSQQAQRFLRPAKIEGLPIPEPTGEQKKFEPIRNTPPIVIQPVNPPSGPHIQTPIRTQGLPITDISVIRNAAVNDDKTSVNEAPDSLSESLAEPVGAEAASGESKSDLGSGSDSKPLKPEARIETTKISDAIFERFAVDAETALHERDFKVPLEAEAVIEQIEKPILELVQTVEEGEPLLLKFRLKPAELGTVEIKLEKNAMGKLNVEIQADSEVAVNLLKESFEQLRESLKDSGWQVDELNIFSRQSGDQALNQHPRGTHGENQTRNSAQPSTEAKDANRENEEPSGQPDDSNSRLVSIRA